MCKKLSIRLVALSIYLLTGTILHANDRKLVKASPPRYPSLAAKMRVQGEVKLNATVESDGSVSAVKVVSGQGLLAGAAADAVKQWKFEPAQEKSTQNLTFDFALQH